MILFRLLVIVLGCSFLSDCSGDADVRQKAKAEVEQMAQQTANTNPSSTTTQPTTNDGMTIPTTGETLNLVLGSAEVEAGKEVCLPVTATGFNELIGLQFSIRWEREQLKYTAIRNMELADLGQQNFGDTHNELGVVALSWIHQSLQGVTLPANSHLFDICFEPQTAAGSKVEVRFEPRPVVYEVINVREELLEFTGVDAVINIK